VRRDGDATTRGTMARNDGARDRTKIHPCAYKMSMEKNARAFLFFVREEHAFARESASR